MTASDMSMEHYERPEVRETILELCKFGGGLRGLNGGDLWYIHRDGKMRLRGPGDFADTISKERSLYMTADVLTPAVFDVWERKTVGRDGMPKPEIPIGTRGDLVSYSLFADIDAVKDPDDEGDEDGKPRSKLYHKGRIEALESAAGFMVRYLKDRGISEAVGVLFSGQGVYVWLSPELSDMSEVRALPGFDRDELDETFKIWFLAFNDLLADIEKAFFEAFPEHVGRVKFDKLNHIKRKVKCLLSIHKKLPFAVIPLDRDDIRIDLEAARIGDHGLPAETLERARVWLSTWKAAEGERSALVKLLEPYRQRAAEDVTAKAKTSGEIRRASEPIPVEAWCPFYQNLLEFPGGGGAHRVCGALATWLYQAGWSEEEAFQLWGPVADRCDVESRIFFTSYGVISSPNCETIKKRGAGYPVLRFGELDLCRPDEKCKGCHWPGDYGTSSGGDGFHLGDFGTWRDVIKKVKNEETGEYEEKVVGQKFELSRDKAATSFSEKMNLAMEAIGGDIHFFDGQIYRPEGAVKISDELYSIAKDYVNRFAVAEVLERLRAKYGLRLVRFDPDPYLLGVRNGVIDLRTGEFRDYRPDDLLTDRIDVAYDPAARCPRYLKFLEEIQPNVTDRLTLVDWFPITAIKKPFPYVLFLLGLGRNGKGIYERLMKRFFGESSFSSMNLDEINRTVFAAGSLRNKRGWIASEQQGSKKRPSIGTGFVKLVSGAGAVDADMKNKARIIFEAFFQVIVDTNAMPAIDDTSIGWMERFCKQDLPYVFVDNPDPKNSLEKQKDPHLFEKLTTDEELSGILNLVIERAKAICKTEAIIKRPAADMFAEYTKQSSSLSTFWDEFCDYTPGTPSLQIPTTDVYEAYKRWCSHLVGEVVNEKYFGAYLKRQCGGISPGRKTVKDEDGNNKKVRYYPGLFFDEGKANKAIEALDSERTIQAHQSPSDTHHNPPKNNISRGIGPSGPSNLWISLIERFGDKEKNSLYMEGISKNDGFDGPDGAAIDSDGSVMGEDGPGDGPNGEVVAEASEDYQTIAENLEEDERRKAEEAERTATPPPKGGEGRALKAIYAPKGRADEYAGLALNLYRGCGHGCVYCYNKDRFNGNPSDRLKKTTLENIEADLRALEERGEKGPVHLSFVGDPYDLARGEDDTRAVLELFHKSGVNFQVLTKGGMKAARDFDLYRPGDKFGCTLTFIDPEKSMEWEPGAALPDDRLRAFEEAHKRGIETWASLEPVIDPAETLELIRRSHKFVDHFKVGRWNHDKRAGGIDWHKFAAEAVALLDGLGCDYYIKDDLRRYLPAERSAPKKDDIEEGRVFGLTHAYYRDLQRQTGGLSIKVLMDHQGWDRDRADIAMGLLRAAGVVG